MGVKLHSGVTYGGAFKGSVGLCERRNDGLQVICISLGRINPTLASGPLYYRWERIA